MGEFEINGNIYRIKKMNAIELLALQSCTNLKDFASAVESFNIIFEHIEVQCGNSWLPVKVAGKEEYYPAEIENDIDTLQQIVAKFIQYIQSVFPKSNASK